MYAAIAQGKGRCAVYAAKFAVANLDRLKLKSEFGDALGNAHCGGPGVHSPRY
jgi:hypothetical protein